VEQTLRKLREEKRKWGLEINNEKTMYMEEGGQRHVPLDGDCTI
jgi:hypothetical protein